MKAGDLVYDELKRVFRYDNGKLYRFGTKFSGFEGQWIEVNISKPNESDGYVVIRYKGKSRKAHRIIYGLFHKIDVDPTLKIDHINGVRHDNRPENLRLGTNRDNDNNRKIHREGKLVGCNYVKQNNKWRATIHINGKRKHLGYFSSEQEAHDAYLRAKQDIIKPEECYE
jgi:hypothetical protein